MCGNDPSYNIGDEAMKMMSAFVQYYPSMAKVIGEGMTPLSQASLKASEATYPQQQALGINTDLAMINGQGGQLAQKALDLDKQANPQFYDTRTKTSNALGDLFGSIDLSGGLSGGERSEIERSVNRANINSGINNPTPTSTVANAMTYGNAATQRKLAQQGIMTGAVGAANQFLPSSKSGIDPFQVATGRSSQVPSPFGAGASASLGGGYGQNLAGTNADVMGADVSRRSSFEKIFAAMPDYSG